MEYFQCCQKNETEKFPKLLNIIDDYQMGEKGKISLHCEFEDAERCDSVAAIKVHL